MSEIPAYYKDIIYKHAARAAAVAIPGSMWPGIDEAGMTAIWSAMILEIASKSGHALNKAFVAKLMVSVLSGIGAFELGSKIYTIILWLTGFGAIVAVGSNVVLDALFTIRVGRVVARRFETETFDPEDVAGLAMEIVRSIIHLPSLDDAADLKEVIEMVTNF